MNTDLFGNKVEQSVLLRDKFIEPPFSVLRADSGEWQNRKKNWINIGIKGEVGRDKSLLGYSKSCERYMDSHKTYKNLGKDSGESDYTSVFDPALTELIYKWFCPDNGNVLDPFAGGSVRGVVANYLGLKYTGIELREEQVKSNEEQARTILAPENQPEWITGDSEKVLDVLDFQYDFIFSCPPYLDLEVYSDIPEDLSTMDFKAFMKKYDSIIGKALNLLKKDRYACFVVGDVRDKQGFYCCFPDMTKMCFLNHGAKLYNEAVLLNTVGSAAMRARKIFESGKKLVKIHQNVLIFKKL